MQSIDLLTYPILPIGAELSVKDLIQRGRKAMIELMVKIPCLKQGNFQIVFDLKLLPDALAIVVKAVDAQLRLELDIATPTLTEFKRSVTKEIKEISSRTNSVVLKEIAGQVFEGAIKSTSTAEDRLLASIRKNAGKLDKYQYDEQLQLFEIPETVRSVIDERVRKVKCLIGEKGRYHAVIYQVYDPIEAKKFKPKKIFKLDLTNVMKDDAFHIHIGPYMRTVTKIELLVKAKLDVSTNQVREYLLVSYINLD